MNDIRTRADQVAFEQAQDCIRKGGTLREAIDEYLCWFTEEQRDRITDSNRGDDFFDSLPEAVVEPPF
jgi:hypothetical protein